MNHFLCLLVNYLPVQIVRLIQDILVVVVVGQEPVGDALLIPVTNVGLLRVLDVLVVGGGRLVHLTGLLVKVGEPQQRESSLDVAYTVSLPEAFLGVLELVQLLVTLAKGHQHPAV